MGPIVFSDPAVKQLLEIWFVDLGEIFFELYLPHSGTGGVFYALTSYAQYQELMTDAYPGSISSAIREKHLPLRGIVDDEFIAKALVTISNGKLYTISTPCTYPNRVTCLGDGNTHNQLMADLEQWRGEEVWLGVDFEMPSEYWIENPSPDVFIGVKPQ